MDGIDVSKITRLPYLKDLHAPNFRYGLQSAPHLSTYAANAQAANICYGTTTPPTASTVPEGTLWIKYTP